MKLVNFRKIVILDVVWMWYKTAFFRHKLLILLVGDTGFEPVTHSIKINDLQLKYKLKVCPQCVPKSILKSYRFLTYHQEYNKLFPFVYSFQLAKFK